MTGNYAIGQNLPRATKRPITVKDGIETTRLGDGKYSAGGPSMGRVATFSPNGKRFVIVLKKGNVEENKNEFALILFESSKVFKSQNADLLMRMSSSSDREGIKAVKWLSDNETIAFIGENPGEVSQVYIFNIRTRCLKQRTKSRTAILNYDVSNDGQEIAFVVDPPIEKCRKMNQARRIGVVVSNIRLSDLLTNACPKPSWYDKQIFLQSGEGPAIEVPIQDAITENSLISFAPNGRHVLISSQVRPNEIPASWFKYDDKQVQSFALQNRGNGEPSRFLRYVLIDTRSGSLTDVMNTPMVDISSTFWSSDGEALFLENIYLPIDVEDSLEREMRMRKKYNIRLKVSTGEVAKIADEDWARLKPSSVRSDLDVTLREDLNKAPKIYLRNLKTHGEELLLDLNPQYNDLDFGKVEIVEWRTPDGQKSQGGLYFPPDYVPGKRYPLVIQTHGFRADRFSITGISDWSSGYVARPLAAKGFIVLQTAMFADNTVHEGPREMARYEGAIDYLDRRGLIDRARVGVSGFSRTVYEVGYALTHSKYAFAAASLVDGMDGGYFQYVAFGPADDVFLNGGMPFGGEMENWLRNSPTFNLDKIHTPLRLEAHGSSDSVLGFWEWFTVLRQMNKPVELMDFPDASHIAVKPLEQLTAQQGLLDWFQFWLNGEEDSDPEKRDEYTRWRHLQKEQVRTMSAVNN